MVTVLQNPRKQSPNCPCLLITEGDKTITPGASSFVVPHDSSIAAHIDDTNENLKGYRQTKMVEAKREVIVPKLYHPKFNSTRNI
jgi:hypothetical protein